MPKVYLLDYVAGNVRSLVNAIEKVGYTVEWVKSPEDVPKADVSAQLHDFRAQWALGLHYALFVTVKCFSNSYRNLFCLEWVTSAIASHNSPRRGTSLLSENT
jgi:hypothetical protein